MEGYSKTVLDHFMNPRNVGEISNADGVGEVGNVRCGDVMYIYIRVKSRKLKVNSEKAQPQKNQLTTKAEEYIDDIKFKTLGCAAAIASTSIMTEMVKGMSLDDALKVTRDDINEALGVLPKQKYHCSILSADGIHKAIKSYRQKQKDGQVM